MGFVRYGVHKELEAAATEMIRQSMEGVTSMAEKSDILTPWKEQDRRSREVYSSTGVPDPSVRKGMYHRAWNARDTHLNSRDGLVRSSRTQQLADFVNGHSDHGRPNPMPNPLGEAGFTE